MINVAVVAGGDSGEAVISIKSAKVVAENIPADKYSVYVIEIKAFQWVYQHPQLGSIQVDKNDFSLTIGQQKVTFNVVFNAIHGTPGEDGKLTAYFEMLGLPVTSCSSIVSALTFNKAYCNHVVRNSGVLVSKSTHIFKHQDITPAEILDQIQLPCFVKPNQGGSSVGMSKVKSADELEPALVKAFAEDTEILIEEFVEGRELTIGVLKYQGKIMPFPITEVTSKKEFFDFEAKYNPALNSEVTPAQIPLSLTAEIQKTAVHLYEVLNLKGVVRFDFIHSIKGLFFLEVNTVPGLSNESIVPKQIRELGYSINQLFDMMLTEALSSK